MRFKVGQVVHHKLFDYRGVIFGADESFKGTDHWYEDMAKTRPPKEKPWYQVLVHRKTHTTYVAEKNLDIDVSRDPIDHPLLPILFNDLKDGQYTRTSSWNGDTPIIPTTIGIA